MDKSKAEIMAEEWINDPLLNDFKGGFTEQVIRALLAEVRKLKKN